MSVYSTTLRQLDRFKETGALNEDNDYLAELALNLATQLDNGAGVAHAAIANQYKAAMDAIRKTKTDDADAEFEQFLSGLGTPNGPALGNTKIT